VTPLQTALKALVDVLVEAREDLDDESYSWLIAVACELVGVEAARLAVGEALRAQRRAA
jgi:hypothetical protein